MKKLYYDCSLIASYMAKNFGVEFEMISRYIVDEHEYCFDFCDLNIQSPETIGSLLKKLKQQHKIYVQPDSYPIFEPKDEDVGIYYNEKTYQNHIFEYNKYRKNWVDSDKFESKSSEKVEIIMRDGKHFFNPQSE